MIISIGEILFDQFPDMRRIGGAPFNVAAHLKSFGFDTTFISRVGRDKDGEELISAVSSYGLNPSYIQRDPLHPTGKVNISLDENGNATFNICKDTAYDFLELTTDMIEKISQADLIYFGTLIQRTTRKSFLTLHELLSLRKPSARTLCDINLRPGCYTKKTIFETLCVTDVLKLNREECKKVSDLLSGPDHETDIIHWLIHEFDIRMVSLTEDSDGSRLISKEGSFITQAEKLPIVRDTVGAGDAYAAVLAGGLLKKWEPEKLLKTASRFAGKICTIQGALPRDPDFYREIKQEMTGEAR